MISAPLLRGRDAAAFLLGVAPALARDLEESAALTGDALVRMRREWECLALYAGVRGLVAAGGFDADGERAVEAMHEAVMARWAAEPTAGEPPAARHARLAARFEAFGRIAREVDAAGRTAPHLGALAAAEVASPDAADPELAGLLAELHEALAEGVAEHVRHATPAE